MMESRCLRFGTIALFFLPLTNAIVSESYGVYLFTAPDQPEYNLMTRDQAQQWCLGNGSTLLEIYDSQMQQIVESFVNKTSGQNGQQMFGNRNMFTNGVRTGTSWMWVNGNNFIAVGDGILNQLSNDYAYGYLLRNQTGIYFVADWLPAMKRNYICEVSGSTSSDCGFIRDGRCYRSYSTTLSWYDARNQCLNGGGDLASFDFVNDQQSLNSLNGSWITVNTQYWIGLRRQSWKWQRSDLEIKYTHWQDGHPQPTTDSCLCLLPTSYKYEWTECNCYEKYEFICMRNTAETSPPPTSSTRTTVASSGSQASSVVRPSSSSAGSSHSRETDDNALRLGVGIGVGVGGSLIIILVIVVVVLLIRRRRQKKPGNSQNQRRLRTPDIISEQNESSHYAEIQRTYDETGTNKAKDKTNIVYSDLQITE